MRLRLGEFTYAGNFGENGRGPMKGNDLSDAMGAAGSHLPKREVFEGDFNMTIKKHGAAAWQGGIKDGKGSISTESGALSEYPYGFAARFEGKKGSNPEELIGAAHASCFTMALSLMLTEAKLTATQLDTTAEVSLDQVEGGYAITAVHLTLQARIPGADKKTFEDIAAKAKAGCPVSKLLKADITLDATLLE